jgi:hypothetical protein
MSAPAGDDGELTKTQFRRQLRRNQLERLKQNQERGTMCEWIV